MSTIRNSGLDQYDAEPFEQQQFGTAGVEGVGHFEAKFYAEGLIAFRANIYGPLDGGMAITLPLEVSTQRDFI